MPVATKKRPVKAKPKYEGIFKDATIEQEWEDGYVMVRIRTREDMAILSNNGGGCASHHWFWTDVVTPASEYFFILMKPDGGVGPILFCKNKRWAFRKHPKEATEFDAWYRQHGGGYRITSDYYDGRYANMQEFKAAWGRYNDPEADLERAKADYEFYKQRALQHGPLGRDNPYKYDVDEANRRVQHCKGVVDKDKASKRVQRGDVFKYGRINLFIVEVAGRGINYDGSNTRYTDKIAEFIGKE